MTSIDSCLEEDTIVSSVEKDHEYINLKSKETVEEEESQVSHCKKNANKKKNKRLVFICEQYQSLFSKYPQQDTTGEFTPFNKFLLLHLSSITTIIQNNNNNNNTNVTEDFIVDEESSDVTSPLSKMQQELTAYLHLRSCFRGALEDVKRTMEQTQKECIKIVLPTSKLNMFHLSVASGNIQLVDYLIQEYPQYMDKKANNNFTPLHVACLFGLSDMVSKLLEHSCRIDRYMYGIPYCKKKSALEKYWNYLKQSVSTPQEQQQQQQQQELQQQVVQEEESSICILEMNALHLSILSGQLSCVQQILLKQKQQSQQQQQQQKNRDSSKHILTKQYACPPFHILIMNPLFLATIQQNHHIVQLLVQSMYNHKSNHTDRNGINPILLCSMFHGDARVTRVLLQSHCNINQIDKRNGNTCLHYAIENGYTKMIKTICELKKNSEELSVAMNHANALTKVTPLQLAATTQHNMTQIEELLKQCGAMEYRTYSEILKEGWLEKEGHIVKSWRLRWFVLKNSCLSYYKSNQALKKCSGMIQLQGAVLENIKDEWSPKRPFCFSIHDTIHDKKYYIVANDEKEKREWMTMLEYAIQAISS